MITDSPIPRAKRYRCIKCDLIAPEPMVVKIAGTTTNGGECANREACARRIHLGAGAGHEPAVVSEPP